MIVRVGWNSQFARRKFDIELDETDLSRIIIEIGLDPNLVLPHMTTGQAHALLKSEAEMLSLQSAISGGVFSPQEMPEATDRLTALRSTRTQHLDQARAFYASFTAPAPADQVGSHD